MKIDSAEIKDLLKAWLVISIAFGIALVGGLAGMITSRLVIFPKLILVLALTAGIGFLLHELGHKIVAQSYGHKARFVAFDAMLLIALLFSLSGFVFAAPGAVFISGRVSKEQNGKIAFAGPLINLLLALLFLVLASLEQSPIFRYGFRINSWLAFCNMLPIWQLDGAKILVWSKAAFFALLTLSIIFAFLF